MRKKRFLLLIYPLLFAITVANAYTGKLYTSDELTSAFISSIAQTRQGYLWVGTGNGLNRFDGYHFKQYVSRENDEKALPHKIVTALFTDKNGQLWVGTAKGLASYNVAKDVFEHYKLRGKLDEEPRITSMTQLHNGNLLVATSGYGIYKIAKGSHTGKRVLLYNKVGNSDFCCVIHVDRCGRLWTGNKDGRICCYTDKGKLLLAFNSDYGIPMSTVCF